MSDVDRNIFNADEFRTQIVNSEVQRQLIEMYPAETGTLLERARLALEKGDAIELHQAAHLLKGVVGNYLGTRAFRATTELDRLARIPDLEEARNAFLKCEAEVKRLERALLGFLDDLQKTG